MGDWTPERNSRVLRGLNLGADLSNEVALDLLAAYNELQGRAKELEAELARAQVVHIVFRGSTLTFVGVETPDGKGLGLDTTGAQWVLHATYPKELSCLRLRVLLEDTHE